MKFLVLIGSIFFLSFQSDTTVAVKSDGFYIGKVAQEYHYIYFHTDGTAETFKLSSLDFEKAYSSMKNKVEPDFSGPYILHAGNIVYRSNNSINKKVQPAVNLFHTYQGKMNEKGQIIFWVSSTDGSKTECTFDFQNFPKE